jgi:hypothetical protein
MFILLGGLKVHDIHMEFSKNMLIDLVIVSGMHMIDNMSLYLLYN